jgi:hypothetical protein
MEVRSRSRVPRRLAAALIGVIVATLMLVPASPAQAASWHAISGETYSNTQYYCSANVRVKEYYGSIEAYFNTLPSPLGNGLRFGVAETWCSLINFSDFTLTGNSQVVAYNIPNEKLFKNMYRRLTSCQSYFCSHTFGGGEYY